MNKTNEPVELRRGLGLWSALALVIGTIIGSGIFFKQAAVLDYARSSNLALLAWLLGGVITLASGMTIAEIGAQMPHTGGLYVYMERLYGKIWGFLSGWMQIIIYGPAMIASISAYLGVLAVDFFNLNDSWRSPIAIGAVFAIALFNLLSNRYGAAFQIITTICKLLPIAAIIIFGMFFGNEHALGNVLAGGSSNAIGNFGVAILATLFAYDGWVLIANMGGELKNPQKILPLAITLGITIVLVAYTLVSYGVLRVLPTDLVHKLGQQTMPYLANHYFGVWGGRLLNIGIMISMIGCINGKIMTFPRIMYAMAKDKELPFHRHLSYLHHKTRTPIVSVLAISCIATIMILTINADRLTEICIFTVYCFYVLAFFGIFKLRRQTTAADRPFSSPLFPLMPIVAIVGALYIIASEIVNDLPGVAGSLLLVLIGVPIYFYCAAKERKENTN